jgi:hypothetical protein
VVRLVLARFIVLHGGTNVAVSWVRPQKLVVQEGMVMSAVTVLSLVLIGGFVATGLVGFFGWRQRMRERAAR